MKELSTLTKRFNAHCEEEKRDFNKLTGIVENLRDNHLHTIGEQITDLKVCLSGLKAENKLIFILLAVIISLVVKALLDL